LRGRPGGHSSEAPGSLFGVGLIEDLTEQVAALTARVEALELGDPEQLLTRHEAAQILGVSVEAVSCASRPSAKGNRLTRVEISPRVIRYRRADVIEYAQRKGRHRRV
jgi:hypothetical protein